MPNELDRISRLPAFWRGQATSRREGQSYGHTMLGAIDTKDGPISVLVRTPLPTPRPELAAEYDRIAELLERDPNAAISDPWLRSSRS